MSFWADSCEPKESGVGLGQGRTTQFDTATLATLTIKSIKCKQSPVYGFLTFISTSLCRS